MRRILLILLAVGLLPLAAAAEETDGFPGLADHVFVPDMGITDPFFVTHFDMSAGLGWTVNAVAPLIDPTDSTLVGFTPSDQVFTGLGLKFQQRVQDWLAVAVAVDVLGRLGSDTGSLLADGITGALDYEFAWKMRIHRSKSVLVSGSVGMGSTSATFINVYDWAAAIVAAEEADLVRSRQSLAGFGGLHAGWGISRRFGVLGSLRATYGESLDGQSENRWHSDFRLAVSYDTRPDLHIPLGLALSAGRTENDADADPDSATWFWTLRFAAQGRSDFSLGLELGGSYFESAGRSEDIQVMKVAIDLRYYY